MDLDIQVTTSPISEHLPPPALAGAGAWVEFRGVVRGDEGGAPVAALEYEAYLPMAEREMRRLLTELSATHPCLAARAVHRIGIVPVGEAAIYVGIAGRHRAEAFALLSEFMDRLKQDVPIWKRRALPLPESPANVVAPTPAARPVAASAEEVQARLRGLCRPLNCEHVALTDAANRVLRESVCAPEDQPPFDRSAVDGYAIRLDDVATRFRIVDEIRAGDWKPRTLEPGEAARIATGGALPGDDLQIVMKEDAHVEGNALTVLRRGLDRNIRFRGEDARAGQVLVETGTRLEAGALGLLASVGATQPRVTRRPRVLHIATGNEIVPPEQPPARGQIRDSNSTLIRAFLARWNITARQHRVGENAGLINSEIRNLKSEVDLLLVSGGASVGEHDYTRCLLEAAGFTIHVNKTTARPGKPLIVAQRNGTLAFGLPGNPLAHFVCLNLYVRVALEVWEGLSQLTGFQKGVLAVDLGAGGNARETFWPARWSLVDGCATVTPLRWSSSGDLTSLATANALIRVTAKTQVLARGSEVEFTVC